MSVKAGVRAGSTVLMAVVGAWAAVAPAQASPAGWESPADVRPAVAHWSVVVESSGKLWDSLRTALDDVRGVNGWQ
ncbi:hypothetical protein ACSMX9_13745 [Streptomyces sp. LE64]|uniref:hypothetical protein n=1 Tax=Streptomyces sp. LE64 TaxID=3448653 RepID=UPI00404337EE